MLRIVLGIALGGIPAVLVAALLVKSMPLNVLRWMVTAVMLYTEVVMLRSATTERRKLRDQEGTGYRCDGGWAMTPAGATANPALRSARVY